MGGPIFTPDNEPYLGLPELLAFDRMISTAMREQVAVASWTQQHKLSPLQEAAAQLVPSTCSIALSIRELIRQGYLVSAMILLRPLVERVGTLTYLIEVPSGLDLWAQGWPYARRPKLTELLSLMRGTAHASSARGDSARPRRAAEDTAEDDAFDQHRAIAALFNELVHGGPNAAHAALIALPDGRPAFTSSKDLGSPGRAANIAAQAASYLLVLTARTVQVFPEVKRTSSNGAGA